MAKRNKIFLSILAAVAIGTGTYFGWNPAPASAPISPNFSQRPAPSPIRDQAREEHDLVPQIEKRGFEAVHQAWAKDPESTVSQILRALSQGKFPPAHRAELFEKMISSVSKDQARLNVLLQRAFSKLDLSTSETEKLRKALRVSGKKDESELAFLRATHTQKSLPPESFRILKKRLWSKIPSESHEAMYLGAEIQDIRKKNEFSNLLARDFLKLPEPVRPFAYRFLAKDHFREVPPPQRRKIAAYAATQDSPAWQEVRALGTP